MWVESLSFTDPNDPDPAPEEFLTEAPEDSPLDYVIENKVIDQIGFEVRSVPFRVVERRSRRIVAKPKPKVAKGTVEAHVFCTRLNSEAPERCSNYYTYRVRPGDTLSSIAKLAYGDSKFWPRIYAYNPHIGKNPQLLRAGLDLIIP